MAPFQSQRAEPRRCHGTRLPAPDPLLEEYRQDGIATLTLNRPRQYNALSSTLLERLHGALDAIANDPQVRVVVIASAGSAFCAGHDLKEMRSLASQAEVEGLFARCGAFMQKLVALPQPSSRR